MSGDNPQQNYSFTLSFPPAELSACPHTLSHGSDSDILQWYSTCVPAEISSETPRSSPAYAISSAYLYHRICPFFSSFEHQQAPCEYNAAGPRQQFLTRSVAKDRAGAGAGGAYRG